MAGGDSRFIGLDVLRFWVASIVIFAHADGFGNAGKIFYAVPGLGGRILRFLPAAGWVAVDIFFVLSGFLVSGLLFKEAKETGTVSVGRFLIRRGLKIYPAFWVMLAFTVGWMLWHHHSIPLTSLLSELFYFQNYGVFLCFHTWSLAVEEHFYFLLAGLFWFLKRQSRGKGGINVSGIPDWFLVVAVSCLILRFVTWVVILSPTNFNFFWFEHSDYALFDSLFFGVWLSFLWHHRWDDRLKKQLAAWRWPLAATGILLILPGVDPIMSIQWFRIAGFILIYLGAGCLLVSCLAVNPVRHSRLVGWLAWLGRHSYSVYLWHVSAGACLFPWVSLNLNTRTGWAADTIIYFVLCWVLGVLMARIIEFPVLRIRDRWFPRLGKQPDLSKAGALMTVNEPAAE